MPLLIVPSHHSSPDSLKWRFTNWFSSDIPHNFSYTQREGWYWNWLLVATKDALDRILIDPEDNFSWYYYMNNTENLSIKKRPWEIDWDQWDKDKENPACYHFTKWYSKWCTFSSPITNESETAKCMRALIEVLGSLPIIPVLQAYLFDPKYFSELKISWKDVKDLSIRYPFWLLEYSKRMWPEFYHAFTWESLLRVSHHSDKDNHPHWNAFFTDPRLGKVKEWDNYNDIKAKFRASLMPILRGKLKEVEGSPKK